ncbi:MAG: dihydroneopterin aldolase [Muribaculaceae bacterium]|nr:dihydroneopterin aldolase [Muribaculum sp.]MCM1295319.1 dihydroneopterin aldolase [Muribaculaceae bacterium]
MTGTIEVNDLRIFARHGVYDFELASGNIFIVTVHLRYPIYDSMKNDNICETLNYAEVVDIIKKVMNTPSKLLENVCFRLHQELIDIYPNIYGGMIRIAKTNPPIEADMKDVAVRIEW